VDEGSLGIHQIEFVVKSREDFSDGSGVGDHADSSHDFGQITSRDNSGGLVVDSHLESSGAPVYELDGPLGLNSSNRSIHILRDHISSVEHRAGHVLSMSGVTFGHHRGRFKGTVSNFSN